MESLNAALLKRLRPAGNLKISDCRPLPERVLQFGEGNFLRGFADWMIEQMNAKGIFNGRVVAVQPTPRGKTVAKLNAQDGLYTVILRGVENGEVRETREVISAISRGVNPYEDWQSCLDCADHPEIEYVISNTTEAGLVYDETDCLSARPPVSFPGKLTACLYRRYETFNGDPGRGWIILPCELVDNNGKLLRELVIRHSEAWGLPAEFRQWVVRHNQFLNTLVDRVVPGYPREEMARFSKELGYRDQLLLCGEPFHFWAIEGGPEIAARLPFRKAGLNVVVVEDIAPYRLRKVRILNGAHTAAVPATFLAGMDTVGEMMRDEDFSRFIHAVIADEIIPAAGLDKAMLEEFARAVMERFQNPFIQHELASILLQSFTKFKVRILPSILDYADKYDQVPVKLAFSFAAFLALYQRARAEGAVMTGRRSKGAFTVTDDESALRVLLEAWRNCDGTEDGVRRLAARVLSDAALWEQDLTRVAGLSETVGELLWRIARDGTRMTVRRVMGR